MIDQSDTGPAIKYRWTDKSGLPVLFSLQFYSRVRASINQAETRSRDLNQGKSSCWRKVGSSTVSFVQLTEITGSSPDIPAHWIYNRLETGLDWRAAWQCRRPPGETAWIIQKIWSPPSTCPNTNSSSLTKIYSSQVRYFIRTSSAWSLQI